jgi:prophage tail gpP-like protein
MPELLLTVGSNSFGGWTDIEVRRSITEVSGRYDIRVSETAPNGDAAKSIVAGQRASISLDGTTVITGYIDEIEIGHSAREHTLTVRGRDAAADLVDCAAIHKTGQWTEQGMLAIANDLTAPFGVKVRAATDLGPVFRTWSIEPGETVFENLDRMARQRSVLVVSDGKGGIVLTTAGMQRVPTALVLGSNILQAETVVSHTERFSEYIVMGQRPRDDENDPAEVTTKRGSAKDPLIRRYRPRIDIVEDVGDQASYQTRANWRRSVSAGLGLTTRVTVQGWSHANGLWEPNTLVQVDDSRLRLKNRELLIIAVRQTLSFNGGTLTELSMMPREAMTPEPVPAEAEEFDL